MKIATWNLQRLDKRKNQLILDKLIDVNADIFALTETNSAIQIDGYSCISTDVLPAAFDGITYKTGENRVSILTKYKAIRRYKTYDNFTSVCTDIETPFGVLTVYGTIIGVFANRQPRFDNDLNGQIADFRQLFPGKQVCIAGDFNTTFSGWIYPSHKARQALTTTFNDLGLTNATGTIKDNVDHIVFNNTFLENKKWDINTWNLDKSLSDHIGVCLTIT